MSYVISAFRGDKGTRYVRMGTYFNDMVTYAEATRFETLGEAMDANAELHACQRFEDEEAHWNYAIVSVEEN